MVNLTNELAKERNQAAAERTMMAWIRTNLSLISFGFGLDKIIAAINLSRFDNSDHAGLSVRLVAISCVERHSGDGGGHPAAAAQAQVDPA
jgi:putative membrane protein